MAFFVLFCLFIALQVLRCLFHSFMLGRNPPLKIIGATIGFLFIHLGFCTVVSTMPQSQLLVSEGLVFVACRSSFTAPMQPHAYH